MLKRAHVRSLAARGAFGLSHDLVRAQVVAAYEAGKETLVADPAADIWALGIIAFELLTEQRVFAPGLPNAEIFARLGGRVPLPWEAPDAAPLVTRLRTFKRIVLQCLHRKPAERPSISTVQRAWERLFDTTVGGGGDSKPLALPGTAAAGKP